MLDFFWEKQVEMIVGYLLNGLLLPFRVKRAAKKKMKRIGSMGCCGKFKRTKWWWNILISIVGSYSCCSSCPIETFFQWNFYCAYFPRILFLHFAVGIFVFKQGAAYRGEHVALQGKYRFVSELKNKLWDTWWTGFFNLAWHAANRKEWITHVKVNMCS